MATSLKNFTSWSVFQENSPTHQRVLKQLEAQTLPSREEGLMGCTVDL